MYANYMFGKTKSLLLCLLGLILPTSVFAHPAEQALVLLLPTELYTAGGTLAVAASIALISLAPHSTIARLYGRITLMRGILFERATNLTSFAATFIFFALIYVGLNGPNDPQRNLLPLTIWTGWWVGLFVIQGLFWDLWRWINPWAGLHALLFGVGGGISTSFRKALLHGPVGQLGQYPAIDGNATRVSPLG